MRGTIRATWPPHSRAASDATAPSPDPTSTASSMARCSVRSSAGCALMRSETRGAAPLRTAPRELVPARSDPGFGRHFRVGLERLFAALARPDPVGLLDRHDED